MQVEWTEDLWKGLADAAPDALVVIEPEGKIVYVSAQTETLFGYAKEELLGRLVECLIPSRFREKHVSQRDGYFKQFRARPMGAGLELFAVKKDGSEFPVETSLSPLPTPKGLLVTAAIRDISDRKRFEVELKKAREVAETANRSKSEFLANMSHEIRTPLAGILGYSEMIALYCQTDEERKGYMEKIRRCSDTLTELINDILDLSKVESGKLKVEAVPTPLVSEVENVMNLLQARANEKNIRLEVYYERPLPNSITTDPTRLRQILINIIGNGIKFTDQGEVVLRVATSKTHPAVIVFSVTDTGCGLSTEEQGRLFQSFVQADTSTTRKYGGTGLGLALSRRLARALGGDLVLAASEPLKGSTFVLTVTNQEEKAAHLLPEVVGSAPTDKKTVSGTRSSNRLQGIRVLLVEDNSDNRELIGHFLKQNGATVQFAMHGKDAVENFILSDLDIILMDLQMPVLDGYEATKLLRSRGIALPIVALTAHAMTDERAKCLAAGFSEFLTKPIDVEKLIVTVGSLVKAKGVDRS